MKKVQDSSFLGVGKADYRLKIPTDRPRCKQKKLFLSQILDRPKIYGFSARLYIGDKTKEMYRQVCRKKYVPYRIRLFGVGKTD